MGDATLLNLDTIAAGQQQMYQTSNDADSQLEKATNDWLAVAMSGDVTLSGSQFTRHFTFVLSGSVGHNLTVPATKRIFAVENDSSASQNVVRGSTTITVAAGDVSVLKTDGTTDGLKAIVASSSAAGAAGGDLTGTYPNPTIGANKVGNTKLTQMATNTIKGNNTGGSHDPIDLTVAQTKTLLAIAAGDVSGLAASATTDTTDASNISSGTLSNSRLTGVELTANKGANNGYASLDSGGKVPTSQLPSAVAGAMSYQGTWNASTNSPALASGVGTQGYFYKVSVAGTTNIDGHTHWNLGDLIMFDGTVWDHIDGTEDQVISVAGKTGVVTLAIGDLTNIADQRIVGNNSGGSGPPIVLTAAQAKTLLAIAAGDVSGLAASATTDTTNASNISSGTVAAARSADVRFCPATFMSGLQTTANQLVLAFVAPIAMVIPSGGTNSRAVSQAAATGSTTFTMKKNGASVGTIVWSTSGTVAAFTVSSTVNLAAGDVLTIVGPATADATLADVAITIYATAAVQ